MKFNAFVPELSVTDIEQSKWFYTELLGFQLEYERKKDKFAFLSPKSTFLSPKTLKILLNRGFFDPPIFNL